jgi:hypothetical protein
MRQYGTREPQRVSHHHLVAYWKQGTPLAMSKEVVWRKLRDLGATLAVLLVLFGMIMAINPRVHERFAELTTSVQSGESFGPVQNAAYAALSIGSDYAADNPFLFSFLVVAVVLFMLMLRS